MAQHYSLIFYPSRPCPPTLPCTAISFYPVLPCSFLLPYPAPPTHSTLPHPALSPYPTLHCHLILPCPTLSFCPALPCAALPCPALPYPTLPCPALTSYPALPYPVLPFHSALPRPLTAPRARQIFLFHNVLFSILRIFLFNFKNYVQNSTELYLILIIILSSHNHISLFCSIQCNSLQLNLSYLFNSASIPSLQSPTCRYISTFYIRRGIDFGSFKRDVLLFKTIALSQLFYCYFMPTKTAFEVDYISMGMVLSGWVGQHCIIPCIPTLYSPHLTH